MLHKCALVFEDRHEDQVLARTQLEAAGWEVFTASRIVDSYQLGTAWLGRGSSSQKTIVMIDLVMDAHALHLAAVLSDLQQRGHLRPAPLVVITAGFSAENMRLARIAGCAAMYEKPLTPQVVAELEGLLPPQTQPQLSEEEGWMREWLVDEGRRLLRSQLARYTLADYRSSPEEVEALLKILSGRGWRPKQVQAAEVVRKFGGHDHARAVVAGLLPFLHEPYASLLRSLLSGSSIEEGGKQLGYCRSHAYQLFDALVERMSELLVQPEQLVLEQSALLQEERLLQVGQQDH